jgi:hypothetical protein
MDLARVWSAKRAFPPPSPSPFKPNKRKMPSLFSAIDQLEKKGVYAVYDKKRKI